MCQIVPARLAPLRLAPVSVEPYRYSPVRLAPLRLALVSVEPPRSALVRFCPLKSQPVRSLPRSRIPASSWPDNWRSTSWALVKPRDGVSTKLPPLPPPHSGWHWSASSNRDCAGEILPAEVPAGQIVANQSDPLQILRLVTGGGLKLPWVKPSEWYPKVRPRDHRPGQVGIGQRRVIQIRAGEILPAEVPAGQVVSAVRCPASSSPGNWRWTRAGPG